MKTTTTDKVQVGDSITGTSTSTTWRSSPPTEYGWACPRCGRVNAPWKSTCDCHEGYYYSTWRPWDYKEPWWKEVTCNGKPIMDSDTFKVHPETTTWKAPSSVCTSDSSTVDPNQVTTTWSAINAVGGSDYYNPTTKTWENVSKNITNSLSNMRQELDELKSTFSNTLRGE